MSTHDDPAADPMHRPQPEASVLDRPVPHPSPLTQPFWDAARHRVLLVQRCADCLHYVFIPQEFCSACRSTDLSWVESAGTGVVVTYTTVWRPQTPAFEVPYIVAVVRLDEGYEMLTNLVGTRTDDVTIGARVRVEFCDITAEVTLPCFIVEVAMPA